MIIGDGRVLDIRKYTTSPSRGGDIGQCFGGEKYEKMKGERMGRKIKDIRKVKQKGKKVQKFQKVCKKNKY